MPEKEPRYYFSNVVVPQTTLTKILPPFLVFFCSQEKFLCPRSYSPYVNFTILYLLKNGLSVLDLNSFTLQFLEKYSGPIKMPLKFTYDLVQPNPIFP